MRIEGKMSKSGSWYSVEIPLLLIHTQGKTKKEAYLMAKDAIEISINQNKFKATITPNDKDSFFVESNDDSKLMAFALKQQRVDHDLTIRDVASRLGSNSPTAYSRYEQGTVKPSLDKFSKLLGAIDKRLIPIISIA